MALIDDHEVGREGPTWVLPDDPADESPPGWPEDEGERAPTPSP